MGKGFFFSGYKCCANFVSYSCVVLSDVIVNRSVFFFIEFMGVALVNKMI